MNSDLTSFDKIEQKIGGSRKISNYIIGGMLTIGGIGFILASISSYTGRDLLPLGNPSTLLFIPQGIIMGAYGDSQSIKFLFVVFGLHKFWFRK